MFDDRYLRRMEFIVVSPELNLPREAYSFELDYPDNENDHDMTFSGTKVTTVESTKGQLVKLIRSLIQFSNTLEEVPNERIINMKVSAATGGCSDGDDILSSQEDTGTVPATAMWHKKTGRNTSPRGS